MQLDRLVVDEGEILTADGVTVADVWTIDRNRQEANDLAEEIARRCNAFHSLVALADKVACLNPDAGEIGDGMLRTIVAMARDAIAKAEGQP